MPSVSNSSPPTDRHAHTTWSVSRATMEESQKFDVFPPQAGVALPERAVLAQELDSQELGYQKQYSERNRDVEAARESKLVVYYQGRRNMTKFAMRCFSMLVSIIAISLSASDDQYFYFTGRAYYWCTPILLIPLLWDVVELVTIRVRGRNPGILSGWHVGVELVAFTACVLAIAFVALEYEEMVLNFDHPETPMEWKHRMLVLLALLALITVDRFGLFVFACVETYRRNESHKVEAIVRALRQIDRETSDDAKANRDARSDYQKRLPVYYRQALHVHEFGSAPAAHRELPSHPAPSEMPTDRMLPVEMGG
ncbi:hypothetical protein F4780DRAFT_686180 [Xylariomycetidae sp. FL0641]|nr:hypothetical protein F4780DRAFT_686180 [Xylariomycetidae sp. FL0641]